MTIQANIKHIMHINKSILLITALSINIMSTNSPYFCLLTSSTHKLVQKISQIIISVLDKKAKTINRHYFTYQFMIDKPLIYHSMTQCVT